ncbi:MAG: hypothetical protein ACK58T_30610 [Phycisphaerae bacterium]|jgi:hypothetical protein
MMFGDFAISVLGISIAFGGAFIAASQLDIARTKLKLEFFDRRYKIYDEAANFISCVLQQEIASARIDEYWRTVQDAEFLLDKQTCAYLAELRDNANALHANESELRATKDKDQRVLLLGKIETRRKWFMVQPQKLRYRFIPYLGFERVGWSRFFR